MNRDFVEMLAALRDAGAEYLVVGAHAVAVVREAFPDDSWGQVALIGVLLMLAMSAASYHFIERPMRRTGHRLAQRFVPRTA